MLKVVRRDDDGDDDGVINYDQLRMDITIRTKPNLSKTLRAY